MRYSLPLSVHWSRFDRSPEQAKAPIVAPVRRANREGVLVEAIAERDLIESITRHIHGGEVVRSDGLEVVFRASRRFSEAPLKPIEELKAVSGEQSNSTIMIDGAYVLKFYRRLPSGPNAESEIGLFLTDIAKFGNSPALLGTVELIESETHYPLAVMHEYIANQGDAWAFTGAYLDRALDEHRVLTAEPQSGADKHVAFLNRMDQIGRRVGELHNALASRSDLDGFAPEPITRADLQAWTETLAANATQVFDKLAQMQQRLDEKAFGAVGELLIKRDLALERIRSLLPTAIDAVKIRHHGDLHLGQILIVKDDAFIIDFEGEPQRSGAERQRKAPSARDVAGVVRSLDYAATAALLRIVKPAPEEVSKLDLFLDHWRTEAARAFYAGVRETVGRGGLWPQDDQAARRLLQFFVVEKAIYEIGYELANRPDWIAVPVTGAYRMLLGSDGAAQ